MYPYYLRKEVRQEEGAYSRWEGGWLFSMLHISALLCLVYIQRPNLDQVNMCNSKLTTVENKEKKITKKKETTSISRIVNVLDAYQMIIIAISCKAISLRWI